MNETEELKRWKRIAVYLASCHAATLEGWPKKGSKSERKRLTEICRKASLFLQGNSPSHGYLASEEEVLEHTITRCENAVKNHG